MTTFKNKKVYIFYKNNRWLLPFGKKEAILSNRTKHSLDYSIVNTKELIFRNYLRYILIDIL